MLVELQEHQKPVTTHQDICVDSAAEWPSWITLLLIIVVILTCLN